MRIGNILAATGIVIAFIGVLCFPLWNLHELPHAGDSSYPKGGVWTSFIQTGIYARPGIIMMIIGSILYLVAKLLPKRYWKTADDQLDEEIQKSYRQKKK